jgi:sortase A
VGWYDDGAEPGEEGNVVLAAHRVTHGEPFADLPSLRAGDLVEVETRAAVRTYRLVDDGDAIEVSFETAWPLWPVPDPEGSADRAPREQMITLVTCSELFHTDDRLIVRGVLKDVEPKRDPPRSR